MESHDKVKSEPTTQKLHQELNNQRHTEAEDMIMSSSSVFFQLFGDQTVEVVKKSSPCFSFKNEKKKTSTDIHPRNKCAATFQQTTTIFEVLSVS